MRAFFFGEGSGRKTSPALSARKAADKATSGDPYAADKATNGDPYIGLNVRRSSNCLFHTSIFGPFSDVSTFQIAILGSSFFQHFLDLQGAHSFAPLQSQNVSKCSSMFFMIV